MQFADLLMLDKPIQAAVDRHPLTVESEAPLQDVIVLMSQLQSACLLPSIAVGVDSSLTNEVKASCVVVLEGEQLVGLITERDLVKFAARGMNFAAVKAADVMTRRVITLRECDLDDVFPILHLFRQHHIRHLPILDDRGHLVGVVTPETIRQAIQPSSLLRWRRIEEVMATQVICANTNTSVLDLARLMAENRVSCVVIVQERKASTDARFTRESWENTATLPPKSFIFTGSQSPISDPQFLIPIGIVTEKDIVQFKALNLDFLAIKAETVMSSPLFCLNRNDSLWMAHQQMLGRRVQRLVVTGKRGELRGIITQTSLLQALDPLEMYTVIDSLQQEVNQLRDEKVVILEERNNELEKEIQARRLQLQQQTQRESLFTQVADRIRTSLNLEDIVNSTVTEVRNLLLCDRVLVYRFNENMSGKIIAESVGEHWKAALGSQIEDTCFINRLGNLYIQGRKWACADIFQANLTDCHLHLLQSFAVKANLVVPILMANELWGLLIAHQCSTTREWKESELDLLDKLAVQIGIAIHQGQLFQKTQDELAERKRAEAALRESERKYRQIVETAMEGIWVIDEYGKTSYANQRMADLLGYEVQEMMGQSLFGFMDAEWQEIIAHNIERGRQGSKEKSDVKFRRKDGYHLWVSVAINPLFDDVNKYMGNLAMITDISDRKLIEEELKKLNEELETRVLQRANELEFQKFALDQAAIVTITDARGIITYANDRFCEISKYSRPELIGSSHRLIKSDYHQKEFFQEMWLTIASGQVWQGEVKNKAKDGSYYWVDTTIVPFVDETGNPFQYLAIRIDITKRKQAEEALRVSEERFRSLFEAAADFIHVVDLDGIIWQTNPAAVKQSGYSKIELIGHNIYEFLTPASQKIFSEQFSILLSTGTNRQEVEFIRKNGTIAIMDCSVSVVRDDQDQFAYIVVIQRDITERKQAEEKLLQVMQLQQAILDSSNYTIISTDPEGIIQTFNVAAQRLLGYTPEEVLGKVTPKIIHDLSEVQQRAKILSVDLGKEIEPGFEVFVAKARLGFADENEWTYIRKDGSSFPVQLSVTALRDRNGKITGFLGIGNDIHARKQAEMALRQQLERERVMIAIAQRIRESLDLEAILNTTVAEVQQILAADRVLVYRVWPNGTGSAIAEAVAPGWRKVLNIIFPEEVFPSENYQPYVEGKVYAVADVEKGEISACLVDFLKEIQVRAKLVVPIIQQDTLWGLLIAHQCSEPRDWQNWEIELLRQLATQLSIAIQQSQLYKQLQVELSDRKQAQIALQQAKDRLQVVLDTVPGLVSSISSDLHYLGVNQHLAAAFNLPPDQIVGQKVGFLENNAEFAEFFSYFFAQPHTTDSQIVNVQINNQLRSYLIVAQKYQQGLACVCVGIDITDRQKAEEQIKASLREKEVLLKEIHHRVKNNLYVVYSLLEMQADSIKDSEIARLFEDSQHRIYSMALIHDKLYRSQNLAQINFGDYLEDLVINLFDSYNVNKNRIHLQIEAEPIFLNIETAAPCGLIVNELVSNTMKHAFPDPREGIVLVTCYQTENGEIHLIVRDNGVGFPENINFRETNSMGFHVVCTLTEQLEGKIELEKENGTAFHLQFTELNYRKRL